MTDISVDVKSIEEWIEYLASTPLDQIKPVSNEAYNKIKENIEKQCSSKKQSERSSNESH